MSDFLISMCQGILLVIFAPLLKGFVKLTKCRLQNRKGPSILQPYRDLYKLFRKEIKIASNASVLFKITPLIMFGVSATIALIIPSLVINSHIFVIADVLVIIGLFALIRFFLALAGMDIGTSFGGMGTSREMMVSALAEPALLLAFFTLAMNASSTNVSSIILYLLDHQPLLHPSLVFAGLGFILVAIAETGRIPVDNPATHLELTMIHEAMILEYSGRNLALIEWSTQIKFILYCTLFCDLFLPFGIAKFIDFNLLLISFGFFVIKLIFLSVFLVIAETNLAKLKLFRVPYLMGLAFLLCLMGVLSRIILEVN